ncbi:MAG: ferredoxin--NADP+ reductase [Candidatus Midichloriaceae bacterium]|nr:ferredoxin--NADP+ reductase [Candidatus Midichloriaceae bacterium]
MNLKSSSNINSIKDVAIIGAGPSGLFTVFEAGMLGMSSVVIDSLPHIGGQCSALYPEKPIYDIPGFPEVSGADLINQLMRQAAPFKPEFILGSGVKNICKNPDRSFMIQTSSGATIHAKVIVIAAGCGEFGPNRPPLEGIEEFENISVFYSVASKAQFSEASVVIAGGGDSALDWTLSLATIAKKIYLVHRRSHFRGMDGTIEKIKPYQESGKVELVTPYQLHALKGEGGKLKSVEVIDFEQNIRSLPAEYLLPFFGLKANLGPIKDWGLELDGGCISVNYSTMETNVPGIFAIGDIASYGGKLKLILMGFAEAARAIHSAYNIVFPDKALHFQYSTTQGVPNV